MGEDEKVTEYVSKVQKLVHLMKACESNQLETLKLEDLVGSLEAREIRIVERKGVQDSIQALQAQLWKKNGGSNKFKGKFDKTQGKKSWSNPHKHQVKDKSSESSKRGGGNYRKDKEDKKDMQCYEKWGHLAKYCWYRKDNGSMKGKDEGANLASQDSDDSESGMVVMDSIVDNHVESKIWFLDLGCSNHMTGQKVWFPDFNEL
ncbi:uncharacterized protein LOC131658001 [Vicia villosa]|uniref:uncharacterized protein LOC131658001 n=1 Tax=Vicia villosa TaxID=3911 RepID=UPI00273B5CF5|nr:uncharacterized protein LOC131658001 [Vicia villosa]